MLLNEFIAIEDKLAIFKTDTISEDFLNSKPKVTLIAVSDSFEYKTVDSILAIQRKNVIISKLAQKGIQLKTFEFYTDSGIKHIIENCPKNTHFLGGVSLIVEKRRFVYELEEDLPYGLPESLEIGRQLLDNSKWWNSTLSDELLPFIPQGYTLIDQADGDLNFDCIPDKAIVIQTQKGEINRRLIILLRNSNNTLQKVEVADNLVLSQTPPQASYTVSDPYSKIKISHNLLEVRHFADGIEEAWYHTVLFMYDNISEAWFEFTEDDAQSVYEHNMSPHYFSSSYLLKILKLSLNTHLKDYRIN